ncbi:MAG TPA: F0F1 ATP synthase subunit B [Gemmatimonadaceae bacterium]|nr:F0F1 ATP synthase subunit B [Gemmatimonadaceae bacterium]
MLKALLGVTLSLLTALPAVAQEAHEAPPKLLSPNTGLMFWTLLIFLILMFVLTRFAFKPLTRAVEAREKALEEAIENARRDREEAAALLEAHRQLLRQGHEDAQRFVVEGRAAGEKVREEIVAQAHREQQQMLERARSEIAAERDRAIAELQREAVNLALLGAGKVIEKDLDNETNRRLVETFLASLTHSPIKS